MKKSFKSRLVAVGIVALGVTAVSVGGYTLGWFNGPNVKSDDNFLDGEIGLRNYFYQGDGTEEKPYEIVQPIHFYNLTRLQNLGVFSGKTYFQVGSVFDVEGVASLRCINRYENGEPVYEDFLDMGEFSSTYDVHSIGGEFAPFVSEINGNGLPIKNLKVLGNPEDVGVFGYIGSTGLVKNMVFDNLEVTSLGYNNNHAKNDYLLFSQDIEDIFTSTSYLATSTSLTLYDHNATTDDYDAINLKKLNGSNGTQLIEINSSDNVVGTSKFFNGYFKPTFPNVENDPFTYSMISSSPIIKTVGNLAIEGADPTDLTFDFTPLFESVDFNKGKEYQANAKIYLVASTKVDGISFSRVIQSYTIEVYSKSSTYEQGKYAAAIFCDYVSQGGSDKNTGYHHGVNVGLLAGHVDGSMKDCYVYNGKIKFNETGFHPVFAESDTGLIGEVGKNVKNNMDPDMGLVVNGDIGIMNFSKIYSLIRSDSTGGKVINAGQGYPSGSQSVVNYVSYKEFINPTSINLFKDYLRYFQGQKEQYEFINSTGTNVGINPWHSYTVPTNVPEDFQTVDFLWNKVIEDDEDVDRGLGVFKVVSSYNSDALANPDQYGAYMLSNIGQCKIVNKVNSPKSLVYFTTAEYDHTREDSNNYLWDSPLEDIPKRGTDLPSYSDVLSFEYPFSRDFDYCFQLDLSQIDAAHSNDYMYNTDSPFLTNYLSSKLIDKYGDPVEPGSPRFGFMFRSSENEFLPALTSYMPVGKPGDTKRAFTSEGTTKYYPPNSIVFSIENPKGANISVVGNNADITVYSFDPDTPSGKPEPLYTMYSRNRTDLEVDTDRYFTYDVATGETGTSAVEYGGDLKNSGAAYGHIFKLKKGHYILGARSGTANIYFLAVQGQTDGTIGANEILSLEDNVDGVDFLLTPPSFDTFVGSLDKALFYYKGVFNNTSGTILHDVYIAPDNKKYMRVTFNNGSAFVLSMHLRSMKSEHIFMFNGQLIDADEYDYTT